MWEDTQPAMKNFRIHGSKLKSSVFVQWRPLPWFRTFPAGLNEQHLKALPKRNNFLWKSEWSKPGRLQSWLLSGLQEGESKVSVSQLRIDSFDDMAVGTLHFGSHLLIWAWLRGLAHFSLYFCICNFPRLVTFTSGLGSLRSLPSIQKIPDFEVGVYPHQSSLAEKWDVAGDSSMCDGATRRVPSIAPLR